MAINIENILIKAYNGLQVFATKMQDVSIIMLYANKEPINLEDFRRSAKRNEIKYALQNIGKNPGLINVANTLEVLNTYDYCNPLNFAISNLFPPGSPVAQTFNNIQFELNRIVDSVRKYNIGDSTKENIAVAANEPIPFTIQRIQLSTKDESLFTKGSFVSVTQTEDPKITSIMRGSIEEVVGSIYTINVESVSPPTPPYRRGQLGNTLLDETGQPLLAEYTNFKIEGPNQISSDAKEIATSLESLNTDLRDIDFVSLRTSIDSLPSSITGISNLKSSVREIEQIVNQQTGEIVDVTGTAQNFLAGNLTLEQVLSRSRKIRDFYNKILPYTDLKFAITTTFKKQIEDINRTLRDFIPYDEIAFVVRQVAYISTFILSLINFLLAIVVTINNIIKTINVVLKVIRTVLKVIKFILKILLIVPFLPAVVVQKPIEFIEMLQRGINTAINLLDKLSAEFTYAESYLGFVKFYLQIIIKESATLAAKLESCENLDNTGLQESLLEASRNNFFALKNLLETMPNLDKYTAGQYGESISNKTGLSTFVFIDGEGTIMPLDDSVFGFDEFGNIIFYGDLTSLSTGVNFEDTLGQDFRSGLQYYTFNKFEAAKHGPLIESADNLYLERQIVADPEDAFGNFQEVYLGYTLKIQEDKPIDPNKQDLLRRRGIALDSENNIVVATNLTFSDDLPGIVNELKYKLKVRVNDGIIGINTSDKQPNSISDSDVLNLAEDLGSNPLALNNIRAQSNNRAPSNISSGRAGNSIEGKPIDPNEPIETRIGGQPFTQDESMGGGNITGANSIQNKESSNRLIDTTSFLDSIVKEQQENDPRVKAISDALKTIQSVDSKTLSNILKSPNSQNLSDEELFSTLKEQVLSSFDPNPNKIEEVRRKTAQWYEGLRESTRLEWEQLTLNYRPPQQPAPPDYEDYFTQVEEQALPQWIRTLLRAGYTESEIQIGIDDPNIRDKWQLKLGPEPNKVEVTLRPAFRIKR